MHIDLWPVSFMRRASLLCRVSLLWRVSLLTLGCEAAPKPYTAIRLNKRIAWSGAASRPSASKLARHSEAGHSKAGTSKAGHSKAGTSKAGHSKAGTSKAGHTEVAYRRQGGICL